VGKIAKIELTKNALLRTVFLAILGFQKKLNGISYWIIHFSDYKEELLSKCVE